MGGPLMLSTSKPSFADALRQADTEISHHGVPDAIERRLRNRLEAGRNGSALRLPIAIAMTASIAAAALFFFVFRGESSPSQTVVAGFAIENASQDIRYSESGDGLTITTGACDVVSAELGIRITNTGKVAIQREQDGIRLRNGTATFSVDKRVHTQAPARIWVSHGVIEVLGTEFTVNQHEHGGDVVLHEGAIRFVPTTGELRTLAPGDSLTWPLPVATPLSPAVPNAPVPEPQTEESTAVLAKPARTKAQTRQPPKQELQTERSTSVLGKPAQAPIPTRPSPEQEPETELQVEPTVGNVFAELAKLRSRRQYEQAVKLLRSAIRDKRTTPAAVEQFSYELGAILTDQLRKKSAACKHWKTHSSRYPNGNYVAEVRSAQLRIGCGGDGS